MLEWNSAGVRVGSFEVSPLSFEVATGEHFYITGTSGIGKTLILETIAGRYKPYTGTIRWHGKSLEEVAPARRNFALLYQDYMLFPHKNALGNVAYPLMFRKVRKRVALATAENMLEVFELGHLARRRIETLSGGEQQRIALCRALIYRPSLLLLDEPYSALDERTKAFVRERTEIFCRENDMTVVEVTHQEADIGKHRSIHIG